VQSLLDFSQVRWTDEGHGSVLSEGQVEYREDVDSHEREDNDADKNIGNLWQAVMDDPVDKASTQIVDINPYYACSKDPRNDNNLHIDM